jgi:hypothetical protein
MEAITAPSSRSAIHSLATTVDGFTFQGGNNADQTVAGGIYLSKGGATITRSTFGANHHGQIFVEKGSAIISANTLTTSPFPNCSVQNDNGGFAIKIWGLSTLVDSPGTAVSNLILNNLIEGNGSCAGIAIEATNYPGANGDIPGPLAIEDNVVRNNLGGISVYATQAIVSQNLIYGRSPVELP